MCDRTQSTLNDLARDRPTHYPTAKPVSDDRTFSFERSLPTIVYPMCDRPTHYPTAKPGAGDRLWILR
ncbi:MAG: hypothetical protein AB4426_34465 [Xenococcaceae cyanobacterium]